MKKNAATIFVYWNFKFTENLSLEQDIRFFSCVALLFRYLVPAFCNSLRSVLARLRISNIWDAFFSLPLIVLFVFHSSCTVSSFPSDTNPIANVAKRRDVQRLFFYLLTHHTDTTATVECVFFWQAII